jgi:hypothetical protein
MALVKIEDIEYKYLDKYYQILKFFKDDILEGLNTKEEIRDDWETHWGNEISSFSTGAERIIYSLLHGKGVGKINSSPVGADLMFETKDAFIHIDVKTVTAETNLGDFTNSFVIGQNQYTYRCEILNKQSKTPKSFKIKRFNKPALPTYYNQGKQTKKICLSYFINILTENKGKDILCMYLACVPNGELQEHYTYRPISAGKNPEKKKNKITGKSEPIIHKDSKGNEFQYGEARYNILDVKKFELLDEKPERIRVLFIDENITDRYKELSYFKSNYDLFTKKL